MRGESALHSRVMRKRGSIFICIINRRFRWVTWFLVGVQYSGTDYVRTYWPRFSRNKWTVYLRSNTHMKNKVFCFPIPSRKWEWQLDNGKKKMVMMTMIHNDVIYIVVSSSSLENACTLANICCKIRTCLRIKCLFDLTEKFCYVRENSKFMKLWDVSNLNLNYATTLLIN